MDCDPGSITIDYHLCLSGSSLGAMPCTNDLEGQLYDYILAARRRSSCKKRLR